MYKIQRKLQKIQIHIICNNKKRTVKIKRKKIPSMLLCAKNFQSISPSSSLLIRLSRQHRQLCETNIKQKSPHSFVRKTPQHTTRSAKQIILGLNFRLTPIVQHNSRHFPTRIQSHKSTIYQHTTSYNKNSEFLYKW